MKIAYFTESLYPHVDGVSRTLARLFSTLEADGVDFRVYSPFRPPSDVSWRHRVREVGYIRFPPYPDYRVSAPFARGVAADLRRFAPDLVHVVSPTPMAYRAQRLARALDVPAVASFHTHFVSYFRYYRVRSLEPVGWWMLRRFYRGCARVYAPSPSILALLGERGIGPAELWSRGIDLRGFSPDLRDAELVTAAGGDERTPILLLVSRLVREKDLADLVQVDRILRQRGVSFTLVIVGDGPMRRQLERALPSAHFTGHLAGPELAAHYASADVFVFPSTTETLGNVVLEALASGLPAVVVDRGGPRDLITPGTNGYVARANDVVDIADRLEPLLVDTALRKRLAQGARASASSRDWDEINRGLLRSYAGVIEEGRSGGGVVTSGPAR